MAQKSMMTFFKKAVSSSIESTNISVQATIDEKKSDKSVGSEINNTTLSDISCNYDPSKENYDCISDACWKKGENVSYLMLARTFETVEATSSRLKITAIMKNYFLSVTELNKEDLIPSIYLCLNEVAPPYEGIELGIGEGVILKAVSAVTGKSIDSLKEDNFNKGDLGLVAQAHKTNQKTIFQPKPLTVQSVFKALKEICNLSGSQSINKKVDRIKNLLVSCRDSEIKYLIRSLEGKLRIGLAEQTVLTSLHQALTIKYGKDISADDADLLKRAYNELPCFEIIIPMIFDNGMKCLKECTIRPGIPVKPMLAHPSKNIGDVLDRFDNCSYTCEYKYDGERAQIHYFNGAIKLFSRNQEESSVKFSDVVDLFKDKIIVNPNNPKKINDFIIDTEIVAWDENSNTILPFQVLTTRKRKDVDKNSMKVKICLFAFDILYYNGCSMIMKPLRERRETLRSNFNEIKGLFQFVEFRDIHSIDEIQEFLNESITSKCEGLMIKTLDKNAVYEIAKRSFNWLKLKKDYIDGVADSLDLVVIGAYYGAGKRVGVYGGFLLASYDIETEEYQTVCKLGTGFSDNFLSDAHKLLETTIIPGPKSYYRYNESMDLPSVWFEPKFVWEVKTADLSISPIYTCAIGFVDAHKGISLRFPRFVRLRDDKKPEDSTTSQQISDFYKVQESTKTHKNCNSDKDDYY